jgi:hypothetical protein
MLYISVLCSWRWAKKRSINCYCCIQLDFLYYLPVVSLVCMPDFIIAYSNVILKSRHASASPCWMPLCVMKGDERFDWILIWLCLLDINFSRKTLLHEARYLVIPHLTVQRIIIIEISIPTYIRMDSNLFLSHHIKTGIQRVYKYEPFH